MNICEITIFMHSVLDLTFFVLQTTYLHESLKGLNSSLAQSDGELLPGEKCPSE